VHTGDKVEFDTLDFVDRRQSPMCRIRLYRQCALGITVQSAPSRLCDTSGAITRSVQLALQIFWKKMIIFGWSWFQGRTQWVDGGLTPTAARQSTINKILWCQNRSFWVLKIAEKTLGGMCFNTFCQIVTPLLNYTGMMARSDVTTQ